MIILYLTLDKEDERDGNPIYDVNIIVDVVISALVSGFKTFQ